MSSICKCTILQLIIHKINYYIYEQGTSVFLDEGKESELHTVLVYLKGTLGVDAYMKYWPSKKNTIDSKMIKRP